MERALAGKPEQEFLIPPGMVRLQVCDESGLLPTEYCPPDHRHDEVFLAEQAPTQLDAVWQKIKIDRTNGLRGSELCPDRVEEKIFAVYPAEARQWAIDHNIPQPPTEPSPNCPIPTGPTPTPELKPFMTILSPVDGETLQGEVKIMGTVQTTNFDYYTVQIGFGHDPQNWIQIMQSTTPVKDSLLATWDTRRYADGAYTIRLAMYDKAGPGYGGRVKVFVGNVPTPTPRPSVTPTNTSTPIPTATNVPSPTPVPPTATYTSTSVPTSTPILPTATRTATGTFTPVPPTATTTSTPAPTSTPILPTATRTATSTFTPVPPTATYTPTPVPTSTPILPTATATWTPTLVPTATPTATPTR
jgi:hypothetical protein